MIVLSILCISLVTYILWYLVKLTVWTIRAANMTANIPGPKPWPIVGNALSMLKVKNDKEFLEFFRNIFYSNINEGEIMKLWVGPQLVILLGHPKHVDIVLSSEGAIDKDDFYKYLALIIGSGITCSNGKKWEGLRKPLNKVLTKNLIQSNMKWFHEKSMVLCKVLNGYTESGKVFDMKHYAFNYTIDVMSVANFGYDLKQMERNNFRYTEIAERGFKIFTKMVFQLPYNICFPLAKISPPAKEIEKAVGLFRNLSNEMLEGRIANKKLLGENMDDNPTLYPDVLLQKARREKLSEREIAELAFEFIYGGADSSAVMISHTLLFLSLYPEHQEALYKEQVDILGEDPEVGPTWEQLPQMTYLTRVLKETLRLFCPPFIMRSASADIDLGDYKIPKDSTIFVYIFALHRDPKFWSHPEEFYPDHFLPEEVTTRPKGAYMPFSLGPRNCPGNVYAMATMRTALSALVRKYKFETDLKLDQITYKWAGFLEIANGCMVRIKPRNIC